MTPQFHVVYDERFHTVVGDNEPIAADTWFNLFTYARDYHLEEDDEPPDLHPTWEDPVGGPPPHQLPPLPIPPVPAAGGGGVVGPAPPIIPPPEPPDPAPPDPEPPHPPNPEPPDPGPDAQPPNEPAVAPDPNHLEVDDTIIFEPVDEEEDEDPNWRLFEDYGNEGNESSTEGDVDDNLPIGQRLPLRTT